jgi:hypothetical protein
MSNNYTASEMKQIIECSKKLRAEFREKMEKLYNLEPLDFIGRCSLEDSDADGNE